MSQVRGWAESIELGKGVVRVRQADGSTSGVPYDSLLLATGSTVDTSQVPGAGEHAHTLSDASSARRLAADLRRAPSGARIAVVGAGLTGIEVASEIAEAQPDARVLLVSRESLGARFSPAGREHLLAAFDRLGIQVLDELTIQAVGARGLEPAHGPTIPFDLAVWCAGFVPRSLAADSGLAVGPSGGALVDRRMRSVSHPEVLAAGDAAECPPLTNGAVVRMSCQAGIPAGAHAADVVATSISGHQERDFDFGFIAWNISLGRKDGLIQWVDRADRPKDRVTRGRQAAWLKEFVTAGGAQAPSWERALPGALRWLRAGATDGEQARGAQLAREQVGSSR